MLLSPVSHISCNNFTVQREISAKGKKVNAIAKDKYGWKIQRSLRKKVFFTAFNSIKFVKTITFCQENSKIHSRSFNLFRFTVHLDNIRIN